MHVPNKKSGISSLNLLLCGFFLFYCLGPSFTVVIRQCSANCSCLALNCIWRQWWSNKRATEQMELGEVQQGRIQNTPIHVLFIPVRKLTHLGGEHHKIVYRHSEMAYIHRRQRTVTDIPWHSVSKRDMSSNGVQKPYIAYRDRRQRD